jgi:hypothetical protein
MTRPSPSEPATAAPEATNLSDYIAFAQACAELPRGRRGRKKSISTLYRWCESGRRGVRLRYVMIGGSRYTTIAWLNEFFEAVTAAVAGGPRDAPAPSRSAARRRRDSEKAGRILESEGA